MAIFQNNRDFFRDNFVCFKSSGGGSSYDAAYNARMAKVAEDYADISKEQFSFYEQYFQPLEKAQIESNLSLVPEETALERAKIGSEKALLESQNEILPGATSLTKAQNEAALSLIPGQTQLLSGQNKYALESLNEKAPVRSQFFKDSLTGVDVNRRVSQAAADASQEFDKSSGITSRALGRRGIGSSPDRMQSLINKNSIERAKTIAGAKTSARTRAEEENYKRLTTAMGY